ncbi:MAG: response regulator transcription factor [Cognatishimia activa]|uniref:Response regulator transcription factor n=1 Tax=Cognatishimia activa TaxID=1715691 RepID=A0A975ESZ4_9RHOB|nr:response regulator transcription factor [Cognatishimia activa]QTN36531.1 response regulator transcription factor [Cognatishimia activa]
MRILIADDHDLVRDTISEYLMKEGATEVKSASSLDEALTICEEDKAFDLLVLDYNMPGMEGLSGLSKAIENNQGTPVAILSGNAPHSVAQEAIDRGAIGFLPKTMTAQSLVHAVRFMMAGETFFPVSHFADQKKDNPVSKQLSKREVEVLNGLCKGQSNKEIASELGLQEVTIKLHVRTLCRKLDAKNRTHAAMIAKEAGLY